MVNREHYFATDMMRFMANKYGIDWFPQEERNELSPFTWTTITGVEAYLQKWDSNIILLHEGSACGLWKDDFKGFVAHFVIGTGIQIERHIFDICTTVARCATLYFRTGWIDSLNVAVEIIEIALYRFAPIYDGDIFDHLDVRCLNLSNNFR